MIPYTPHAWFWFVAGDETRVYSSAARAYVGLDDPAYRAFLERGGMASRIGSEEDLWAVLRLAGAPPCHLVATRVIVDRLQAVGKLAAARAALDTADLYLRERWNTRAAIYADDADARALLGADADAILAPGALG